MPLFEYRQAEEVRDALRRHGVRYLFIGKSGAILLGFPDTTQDADVPGPGRPATDKPTAEAGAGSTATPLDARRLDSWRPAAA